MKLLFVFLENLTEHTHPHKQDSWDYVSASIPPLVDAEAEAAKKARMEKRKKKQVAEKKKQLAEKKVKEKEREKQKQKEKEAQKPKPEEVKQPKAKSHPVPASGVRLANTELDRNLRAAALEKRLAAAAPVVVGG